MDPPAVAPPHWSCNSLCCISPKAARRFFRRASVVSVMIWFFGRRSGLWFVAFLLASVGIAYLVLDPGLRLADAYFEASLHYIERDQYSSLGLISKDGRGNVGTFGSRI